MTSRQLDEETIFHTARKITDVVARKEYLDQICAGDLALRQRVESLILVHEQESEFLKSNPKLAPTLDQPPILEAAGQEIGRYKLLQQIGEGGFGVVYMAEQSRPVRRKVALKVIKPGMDTKAVVARFEAERQALAIMDHENIARVLDGGATESGKPYFVMELVRGVPITEYCDQNHLPTDQRLKLFITVCQAVQHAHQKGLIHRDIKPSNVLVTLHDGKPVVKVIDFGVAKAINQQLTEKTLFTSYGQMIGTPQYMSPEQAEMSGLDVDTRSDIYSLGVLLYELLTGTTPLESDRLRTAGYAEMQRLIREEEPPKPSTRLSTSGEQLTVIAKHRSTAPEKLAKVVRGELDWIVMKALEKDRSRRYATANGLADDVCRYQKDEPVLAPPPSLGYSLGKFSRRYRWAISISSILVSILVAGIGATTWMWMEAIEQAGVANEQRARADREAEAAKSAAGKLSTALNRLQAELVQRALGEALAGDLNTIETSLKDAEYAEARPEVLATLRALAYLNSGKTQDAVLSVEDALRINPTDVGALATCFWVHQNAGHYGDAGRFIVKVNELQAKGTRPLDDYEQLLIAQFRVFALDEPGLRALIAKLDEIISRRKKSGLAYSARSDARRELAKRTRRQEDVEAAMADAALAMRYQPDNPATLTSALYATLVALELAEFQNVLDDLRVSELRAEGARLADQLEHWTTYFHGQGIRLAYFMHTGQIEKADMIRDAMLAETTPNDQVLAARALVNPDPSELDAYLERKPDSLPFRVAVGVRHAMQGHTQLALNALDALFEDPIAVEQRGLLFDIGLIARQPDKVRELAKRALQEWRASGELTNLAPWDIPILRFYAGEMTEREFIEFAGPFHFEHITISHMLGLWKYANAQSPEELNSAKKLLRDATKCAYPGWWTPLFSDAYLTLIEDGRISINKRQETGS